VCALLLLLLLHLLLLLLLLSGIAAMCARLLAAYSAVL
jgi:hypothetical protein